MQEAERRIAQVRARIRAAGAQAAEAFAYVRRGKKCERERRRKARRRAEREGLGDTSASLRPAAPVAMTLRNVVARNCLS